MKILFTVEFYWPRIGGAEEVVKQLAERLVSKGHAVTVATGDVTGEPHRVLNGVSVKEFKISGNEVRGISGASGEIKRYVKLLRSGFDVILNYAAQNWPTDLALPLLPKLRAKRVLVPCGYSGLCSLQYVDYFDDLPERLRHYDKLVYMSENYQDRKFGEEHGLGDKTVLIVNGAAHEEFDPPPTVRIREKLGIKTSYLALSVGNHFILKNHRFVIQAFKKMNRPDVSLLILGDKDSGRGHKALFQRIFEYGNCLLNSALRKNVYVADGRDREMVLSAYKSADIFLFGSRVECAPLVMYESFAARLPFITTKVGNVADHSDALCMVQNPEEMAGVASNLLDHPEKAKELTARGYEIWRSGHFWHEIAEQYEKMFLSLL